LCGRGPEAEAIIRRSGLPAKEVSRNWSEKNGREETELRVEYMRKLTESTEKKIRLDRKETPKLSN